MMRDVGVVDPVYCECGGDGARSCGVQLGGVENCHPLSPNADKLDHAAQTGGRRGLALLGLQRTATPIVARWQC